MIWMLPAIAVCLLAEGFFSGSEIGFYSVNRLRLRSRVEGRWPGAAVLQGLLERPDLTIMTTLVGTNIMVYAASAMATRLLSGHEHTGLLTTLILTPLVFLFGEMIPKDIYRRKADVLMYVFACPVRVFRAVAWPILIVLRGLVFLVTHKIPAEQRSTAISRAALREWIAEGTREGVLSDYQLALSANVMDLLKKKVSSVMIPLGQAVVVSEDLSGPALREALLHPGHSRLPVQGRDKTIAGILHTLDYICAAEDGLSAGRLARPAVHVRQTDGITAVLVALQSERQHMAIVVDDASRPVGIVTVKDLVEEIVGELHDF